MRFVFRKDVRPGLIGRALLRYAVHKVTGLDNQKIFFERTLKGKPVCSQMPNSMDLNLSHHGDYCVLACDSADKVGVDTMKIEHRDRDLDRYFDLMHRCFSNDEWTFIKAGSDRRERLARFMRLWSLKEAYVKAEGFGITVDLQSISFTCHSDPVVNCVTKDTKLTINGQLLEGWTFEETLIDNDHCAAVALNCDTRDRNSEESVFQFVSIEQLIEALTPLKDVDELALVCKWTEYCHKDEKPQLN